MEQLSNQEKFEIKKIKEIFFFVNEKLHRNDPKAVVKSKVSFSIAMSEEDRLMRFEIGAIFHYEDAKEPLAENRIENIYFNPNLSDHIKNGFPISIIVTILDTSVSHLRALFFKNIATTVYDTNMLSLIDVDSVVNHFFSKNIVNERIMLPLERIPAKSDTSTKPKKKKS